MITSKKIGCEVCPRYGSKVMIPHDGDCSNPDLLIIGESPEMSEKVPLTSERWQIIRALLRRYKISAVLFNAIQCQSHKKPDAKSIKVCREEYVLPILDAFPNTPVVVLGDTAAKSLLGGAEKGKKGQVLHLYGHDIYFTYDPSTYLSGGKDRSILLHIETMIKSSVSTFTTVPNIHHSISTKDVQKLLASSAITMDIESTGSRFPWYGDSLLLVGLKQSESPDIYSITGNPEGIIRQLKFLENYEGTIVGHNILFDLVYLRYSGLSLDKCKFFDTKIGLKLQSTGQYDDTSLKFTLKKSYGYPGYEAKIATYLREHNDSLLGVELEELREYNARDVIGTEQIANRLVIRQPMAFNLAMDYMHYVVEMIYNGSFLNKAKLRLLRKTSQRELNKMLLAIHSGTYIGFNPNSWQQIKDIFKKMYGLSLPDTTKETMESYSSQYPLAKDIANYRKLTHFKGTVCDGYLKWMDKNNIIHSQFSVAGAITHRMTSSSPNLQNDDIGVRGVFESRYPEGVLLYSDLASLEYRLIAHLAKERKLLDLFNAGKDIHKAVYSDVFGVDLSSITDEQRQKGKLLNYTSAYGQGATAFFSKFGISDYSIYDRVKGRYSAVNLLRDRVLLTLRKTRSVNSLFGRVWLFDKVTPDIEREAFNYIIQSTGHDILCIYLMEVADSLAKKGLHSVLLTNEKHDSFVFDCPRDLGDISYQICKEIGKDLNPLILQYFGVQMSVPFYADVKLVSNLGEV